MYYLLIIVNYYKLHDCWLYVISYFDLCKNVSNWILYAKIHPTYASRTDLLSNLACYACSKVVEQYLLQLTNGFKYFWIFSLKFKKSTLFLNIQFEGIFFKKKKNHNLFFFNNFYQVVCLLISHMFVTDIFVFEFKKMQLCLRIIF